MEFTLAAADAEPDYDAQTSPHGGEIASVVKGVHSCLLHNRRWTRPVYLSSREPRDVISMRPGNRLNLLLPLARHTGTSAHRHTPIFISAGRPRPSIEHGKRPNGGGGGRAEVSEASVTTRGFARRVTNTETFAQLSTTKEEEGETRALPACGRT